MATSVWCSCCAGRALERPGSRPECGSGLAPAGFAHEISRQTGIHPGHIGVLGNLSQPTLVRGLFVDSGALRYQFGTRTCSTENHANLQEFREQSERSGLSQPGTSYLRRVQSPQMTCNIQLSLPSQTKIDSHCFQDFDHPFQIFSHCVRSYKSM